MDQWQLAPGWQDRSVVPSPGQGVVAPPALGTVGVLGDVAAGSVAVHAHPAEPRPEESSKHGENRCHGHVVWC